MPYIIDGHNLIGKLPSISLKDMDDEIQLIQALQAFCQRESKTVEVYFDNAPPGVPRARNYGAVTAYFIRSGKTADQAIQERLKKLKAEAKNLSVVSSDRQVQAAARAAHSRVISSEEFARILFSQPTSRSKPDKPPGDETLSPEELTEWLDLFSGDKADQSR
jgi:predicted RNA-binding protein with PIN domain